MILFRRRLLKWVRVVKINMKTVSLLLWVTQFGFSVLFPICFFLLIGVRLQERFHLGMWFVLAAGVLGLLTSIRTARSCISSLRKASQEAGEQKEPPVSFNDHE